DIVLVSDYDKGVCTAPLLAHLISAAKRWGLRVLADPIRGSDYRKYHGCTALTPNRLEAGLATGCVLTTVDEALDAASRLREQLGASPVCGGHGTGLEKLFDRPTLLYELGFRRRLGQRVAFTNGCFDVLHAGHVQYLREARAQADLLIVGLNSDASVHALKGDDRPVNDVQSRAAVLNGLAAVDYLTIFDGLTPLELIREIR